jgi:uncharacterized membrane protein (UPF0127 family)
VGGILKNYAVLLMLWTSLQSARAVELTDMFKKNALLVGSAKITAYLADNDEKRARGLMFVEKDKLAENTGMLFIFDDAHVQNFWMKNTLIPLSIGFFDACGVLIDVQDMQVASSLMDMSPPTYQSRGPAMFALEMNLGWFSRRHIGKGAHLTLKEKSASQLLTKQLVSLDCARPQKR